MHFFGVFDGHGELGTECAQFAQEKVRGGGRFGPALLRAAPGAPCRPPSFLLTPTPPPFIPAPTSPPDAHSTTSPRSHPSQLPANLRADAALHTLPVDALHYSTLATNRQLHESPLDDSLSGTTACCALTVGPRLYVANVGDSRAVLAEREEGEGGRLLACELSMDQTPFRCGGVGASRAACMARACSLAPGGNRGGQVPTRTPCQHVEATCASLLCTRFWDA